MIALKSHKANATDRALNSIMPIDVLIDFILRITIRLTRRGNNASVKPTDG
jgi:hypothetical protein